MGLAFDVEKSAQVAAVFIELNGGSIDRYALVKMLYEADRDACRKWGHSMTGDEPFSMEHGPVLSAAMDLTKGSFSAETAIWRDFFSAADIEHVVTLKKAMAERDSLRAQLTAARAATDRLRAALVETSSQLEAIKTVLADHLEYNFDYTNTILQRAKRALAEGDK